MIDAGDVHLRRVGLPCTVVCRLALFVAMFGVFSLAGASASFACSVEAEPVNDHCYSQVEWNMNQPKGEEVYGAEAELETYYGNVPLWKKGDFITNELWVSFENSASWVEGGAVIGNGSNESTPYYFVARQYNCNKCYYEFDYYPAGPAYNTWYTLYIDEPGGPDGEWCTTWAWDSKPDFCFAGFWKASDELTTGMEYGTTTSSGADNNGRSVGWDMWTNGTWHRSWQGAYSKAEPYYIKPMCINAPAPGYGYGSIAFAAPGC